MVYIDCRDISESVKNRTQKELNATKEHNQVIKKSLSNVPDKDLMFLTDTMVKSLTNKLNKGGRR